MLFFKQSLIIFLSKYFFNDVPYGMVYSSWRLLENWHELYLWWCGFIVFHEICGNVLYKFLHVVSSEYTVYLALCDVLYKKWIKTKKN
jgi:hypothetical protein